MKTRYTIIIVIICTHIGLTQAPVSQIEGYLEVSQVDDSTSMYIGREVARSILVNNDLYNSFIGSRVGVNANNTVNTTIVGSFAGEALVSGFDNSFFGTRSGTDCTGGINSFFGSLSGVHTTSGVANSFFGYIAGSRNITGNNNTLIGSSANFPIGQTNLSFASAIGSHSEVSTSNTLVFGRPEDVVVAPNKIVVGQPIPDIHDNDIHLLLKGDDSPTLSVHATNNTSPRIQLTKAPTNANSGWTMRLATTSSDELQFRHHNNIRLGLSTGGILRIPTLGASGSTSLGRNASNQISTCTSSLRYKEKVEEFTPGLELLYKMRPVSFFWKEDNTEDIGFIAEEIGKIDERLITRNGSGEIEGIKYDRLTAILVNSIREQQAMISTMQSHIADEKKANEKLTKKLARVLQRVDFLESKSTDN